MKVGQVALVGLANVGKSTLLNELVQEKVAIVTHKKQTTRQRFRGIRHGPGYQMLLVDTPGFNERSDAIDAKMRGEMSAAVLEADVLVWVVDASEKLEKRPSSAERRLLKETAEFPGRRCVVLNKVDRVRTKEALLPFTQAIAEAFDAEHIFPLSARNQKHVEGFAETLVSLLPDGESVFETDTYTDATERQLVAELVREQLLLNTHQEIPHGVAVVVDEFLDQREPGEATNGKGPFCRIEARVVVSREGHRPIVLGKRGERIKTIGMAARKQIEALLGCQVHLGLRVEVDPNWTRDPAAIRRYFAET